MNRRLYFILPDVKTALKVEQDLLLARIEESRMHFLAKRGTDLQTLLEARPVYWLKPIPEPPPELSDLHFDYAPFAAQE